MPEYARIVITVSTWPGESPTSTEIRVRIPSNGDEIADVLAECQGSSSLRVRAGANTEIDVDDELEPWLPLLLIADPIAQESGPCPSCDEWTGYFDEIDASIDFPTPDRMVKVNGATWGALPLSDSGRVVIAPVPYFDLIPVKAWAQWSWCELGSMTAGWDISRISPLTSTVAVTANRRDEAETVYEIDAAGDPAEAVYNWLVQSSGIDDIRTGFWPADQPDPIWRMFATMRGRGLTKAAFMGGQFFTEQTMGATDSTEWHLELDFPSGQLAELDKLAVDAYKVNESKALELTGPRL